MDQKPKKILVKDYEHDPDYFVFISFTDDTKVIDNKLITLSCSYITSKKIFDHYDNENIILIKKKYDKELMPNDVVVININNSDNLLVKKHLAIKKATNYLLSLSENIPKIDSIHFISYFEKKFELASKGFFITQENSQEQYINILLENNKDTVESLENFLNTQRMIKTYLSYSEKYIEFELILKTLIEEKDVEKLSNLFCDSKVKNLKNSFYEK